MLAFVRQLFRDRQRTGAVLPSSPLLAKAMTESVRQHRGPKRVLEVGPGTGPFTRAILRSLSPGDELHLIEVSPIFAQGLEDRLLRPFRTLHPDIHVELHCLAVEDAPLEGRFDYIVCGLPFNNFPPRLVRRIFRQLLHLLAEDGELMYFEYAGVRAMKGPLVGHRGRRHLRQIGRTGRVLLRKHDGRRKLVLGNMPPAVTIRLAGRTGVQRTLETMAPSEKPASDAVGC